VETKAGKREMSEPYAQLPSEKSAWDDQSMVLALFQRNSLNAATVIFSFWASSGVSGFSSSP
jgi:hypothetical protein